MLQSTEPDVCGSTIRLEVLSAKSPSKFMLILSTTDLLSSGIVLGFVLKRVSRGNAAFLPQSKSVLVTFDFASRFHLRPPLLEEFQASFAR
ncbi:hypothetical protein CLCR_07809 [Cladophialophora carrionii]|uniref:Uncharacterized protein n=1 Tax=Cladophialophora carrionii TaxID=86049 RepID=A0A1C1CMH5_9EURO|nr:hypothetical protein CLCR_07809 [Cladophialophora carrionii]